MSLVHLVGRVGMLLQLQKLWGGTFMWSSQLSLLLLVGWVGQCTSRLTNSHLGAILAQEWP